jgi:hypothetical protein
MRKTPSAIAVVAVVSTSIGLAALMHHRIVFEVIGTTGTCRSILSEHCGAIPCDAVDNRHLV